MKYLKGSITYVVVFEGVEPIGGIIFVLQSVARGKGARSKSKARRD